MFGKISEACRHIGFTEDPIYRYWMNRLEIAWAAYDRRGVAVDDPARRGVLYRKWWPR